MKILFLSDSVPRNGGEGNYTVFLIKNLRQKGHQVKLISNTNHLNFLNSLVHQYLFSYFSFKWKKKIEFFVNVFKPDIIFIFGITRIISPYCLSSIKKRVPIIMQMSGSKQFHYFSEWDDHIKKNPSDIFLNISFLRILLLIPKKFLHNNLFLKIIDHYVAPSETTAKITQNKMGISDKKISIIRHPSLFNTVKQISKKENFILYVGRLNKEKGVNYLIKAFKIVHDNFYNDVKLIIVGDGPERKKLEYLSKKLGLSEYIDFLGMIEHKKIKILYQKSLLFILPSIVKENFGLVLLESMSQGTPVITTNIGGQRELVIDGYNGFLTNPENYIDLANKIERVLLNTDERTIISKNSIIYSKKYSKEKNIKEIEVLFKKTIENWNR